MKWLKVLFDFYLDASVHVALAIVSLLVATCLTLNISVDYHLALFLFLGSISCYNFVKYGVEAEKYLKLTNSYHKGIQIFSFVLLFFAVYHAYFIHKKTLIGIVVLVLITGIYAVPLLPKSRNLRSLSGLKIFVVAVVWGGATVCLPVLQAGVALTWDVCIATLQLILLVLVLLVPFEIRDLSYDAAELKTMPQRFGASGTKLFGIVLTIILFLLTFLKDDIAVFEVLGKGILAVLLAISLLLTREQQSKYFASFWVEGIPVLWVGIVYALKT